MNSKPSLVAIGALAATLAACAPGFAQQAGGPGPGPGPGPLGPMRMFQETDANSDGRVTVEEMRARVAERFAAADADRDNALTPEEFRNAMPRRRADAPPPADERHGRMLEMRFRIIDANADGRVTLDEMQAAAGAMFRGMDANSDGAVTQEELPRRRHHHGMRPG